jgi:hypothetical protein
MGSIRGNLLLTKPQFLDSFSLFSAHTHPDRSGMNLLGSTMWASEQTNLEDKYMRVARGAFHPRVSSS